MSSTVVTGSPQSNIDYIEFTDDEMEMCEITVSGDHSYYADGIVVHNSSQELRVPTNMSREKVWLDAFLSGKDVHKSTAVKIYGEENYTKDLRKKVKGLNFGILYGMSPKSIADRFNMTMPEAEKLYNDYKAGLPDLFNWINRMCETAKARGTAYTHFGRPRRVFFWFSSEDRSQRAFAYRTVTNTIVQGTSADLLKIALIRLWKKVFTEPKYKEDCLFRSTVHDEVNFSVVRERVPEMLDVLVAAMTLRIPHWPVPMEVGVSVGTSWGTMFEFEKVDGTWIPKFELEKDRTELLEIAEEEARDEVDDQADGPSRAEFLDVFEGMEYPV